MLMYIFQPAGVLGRTTATTTKVSIAAAVIAIEAGATDIEAARRSEGRRDSEVDNTMADVEAARRSGGRRNLAVNTTMGGVEAEATATVTIVGSSAVATASIAENLAAATITAAAVIILIAAATDPISILRFQHAHLAKRPRPLLRPSRWSR